MAPKGHAQSRDRATPTKMDLIRFIEWAVDRAKDEQAAARGTTTSFLQALEDDGRALLRRVRP